MHMLHTSLCVHMYTYLLNVVFGNSVHQSPLSQSYICHLKVAESVVEHSVRVA